MLPVILSALKLCKSVLGLALTTPKKVMSLFSKRDVILIAFFTLLGIGGVFASALITVSAPNAQGAGYIAATSCDDAVTIKALTAPDSTSGQLYVATIALSNISQNLTTGCGNKTMELILKINGQLTYASWDIPAESLDNTFNFTSATSAISDYYANTALTAFKADGLTNVSIAKIGSFSYTWNWTNSSSAGSHQWTSIASSADGVNLAMASAGDYIYYSSNSGVTWDTKDGTSGQRQWRSIASSSDGTKLAATVFNGSIYTSADSGLHWQEVTQSIIYNSGSGRDWRAIASSSDGTKLVAVARDQLIYTSTDSGAKWGVRTGSGIRTWQTVASSSDGTKLAAAVNGGYIYTSDDSGDTWSARKTDANRSWQQITSSTDGTKLAAVEYGGYVYTSTDSGVTWTQQNGSGWHPWFAITSSSDGSKLAATAYTDEWIYTSEDYGVTWTKQNDPGHHDWYTIASSANGRKLIAANYNGNTYSGVSTKVRSNY